MIIVHASDLHYGPHWLPAAADAFLRVVRRIEPQLVVVSGDFTHRANQQQFGEAKAFLAKLPQAEVILTPGNHDVPTYAFWRRLFHPYREYRNALGPNGDFVVHAEHYSAAVLDTTSPYLRITEGRLTRKQVAFLRTAFRDATADLRMVVAHHPIAKPSDWRYGRSVDPNRDALTAMVDEGVELVLGGHLHRSFMMEAAAGVWIVHAGTATSTRGRSEEQGMQTFNVLRVAPTHFDVEVLSFSQETREFETLRRAELPRLKRTELEPAVEAVEKGVEKAASGI